MKKLFIALTATLLLTTNVFAASEIYNSKIKDGVRLYKIKNYTACLQTMEEVIEDDPSNVLAHYYSAISLVRIGKKTEAKDAYQKVIDLNSSSKLTIYAKTGILCLDNPSECPSGSGISAIDEVKETIKQKQLDSLKDIVNTKKDVNQVPKQYYEHFDDLSQPKNQEKQNILNKKSEATKTPTKPSNDEIVAALNTLKNAGYNPMGNLVNPMNQMNMNQMSMMSMMGGNSQNNNGMGAMLPLLMMQSQGGNNSENKMSPEFIQAMMMNSMMGDVYSTFGNNKDNN